MTRLSHLNQMQTQQAARRHAMQAGGFTTALDDAQSRAAKLTRKELGTLYAPLDNAKAQAKCGRLTEYQWLQLCSALNVGQAIESGGVVRGLAADFDAAHDALQAITDRATANNSRPWTPTTLYESEMAAIDTLVTDYKFQLRQVSYGEYLEAWRLAKARVRSSGGEVVGMTDKHIATHASA